MEYLRDRITLAPFAIIWGVYFALLWLAGFRSSYGNFGEAVFYQVLFFVLVCLPVLLLKAPEKIDFVRPSRYDRKVFLVSIALGLLALAFIFYDRLVVQNIDYSGGVCLARGQMTRLGLEREGVSSAFSVLGQLFGYAYFVAAAFAVTRVISRRTFWTLMGICFALLMLQAQVAASRAPLILFATFIFAAVSMRVADGGMPRIKAFDIAMTALFGLIAVGFVVSIFSCRAAASNQTTAEYASGFTEFLGAKDSATTESAADMQHPSSAEGWRSTYLGGLFSITALYTVHSAYTFAGIISMPPDSQILTLDGPLYLLNRVGIHIQNGEANEALAGRFPSLPGTLYHDFGVVGVVFGGLFLGFALWATAHLVSKTNANVVAVGVACAVFTVAYVSPLLLATNITVFPFVSFSFFAVPALAYLVVLASPDKRGRTTDDMPH